MDGVTKAVEFLRGGCACSQSILAAYGPGFWLDETLSSEGWDRTTVR